VLSEIVRDTRAFTPLLETIVGSHKPMVPFEFIGSLINQVAESLGLDTTQTAQVVSAWGTRMQDEMDVAFAAQDRYFSVHLSTLVNTSQQ